MSIRKPKNTGLKKVKIDLTFGEKTISVMKDVGVKIAVDTLMSREKKKEIVFKWPEIVQTAMVSAFYVNFIENMIFIRFREDMNMAIIVNFLVEIVGKSIADIIARVLWNTLIGFSKDAKVDLEKNRFIRRADVRYANIVVTNIIGSGVNAVWRAIRPDLMGVKKGQLDIPM
jgi:hypothetical protein